LRRKEIYDFIRYHKNSYNAFLKGGKKYLNLINKLRKIALCELIPKQLSFFEIRFNSSKFIERCKMPFLPLRPRKMQKMAQMAFFSFQ